ncbi:MAG TPA: hypothetical protein VGD69_06910 [Herpetosiphonaceae bacterium]
MSLYVQQPLQVVDVLVEVGEDGTGSVKFVACCEEMLIRLLGERMAVVALLLRMLLIQSDA